MNKYGIGLLAVALQKRKLDQELVGASRKKNGTVIATVIHAMGKLECIGNDTTISFNINWNNNENMSRNEIKH